MRIWERANLAESVSVLYSFIKKQIREIGIWKAL